MERAPKILAIQFKYFGDTALMVPALRAIHEHHPGCSLHVLVPEDVAPLVKHLPWLACVWVLPRKRGRARIKQSWPVIRALRLERFDRSVDFGGNDRGAILSLLCGARERLGLYHQGGFMGRRFCYTQRVPPAPPDRHETLRLIHVLSAWGISPPDSMELEIHTDPALDAAAQEILSGGSILCHIACSQPKKEWPLAHWATLHRLAGGARMNLIFGTGVGAREEALLHEFKKLAPDAPVLQPVPDLALYLAVLKRAKAFVSGDTGPLHFAAGVGVPTLAFFGPTSAVRWKPPGQRHQALTVNSCSCGGDTGICLSTSHCLAAITPEQVFNRLSSVPSRSIPL